MLYSTQPIPREDVPKDWYCYDLRGTVRHPDKPYALVDRAEENPALQALSDRVIDAVFDTMGSRNCSIHRLLVKLKQKLPACGV